MKRFLFALSAALLLSVGGFADADEQAPTREQAQAACTMGMLGFLDRYEQAKKQMSERELLARVDAAKAPKAFNDAIHRFVVADFKGDRLAANEALRDAIGICVQISIQPHTTEM